MHLFHKKTELPAEAIPFSSEVCVRGSVPYLHSSGCQQLLECAVHKHHWIH